jgi:hypothetical protein
MGASIALNLGFLTVLQETNGYVGGYLVTNVWGRPLEFRLSTAVQPNRVQQILYGGTLQAYVCAEVIGRALVDKTATPVQVILTDRESVLELRASLTTPVAWSRPIASPPGPTTQVESPLICHRLFPEDRQTVQKILDRIQAPVDLAEPFVRIRDAIAEARKMGVTTRA